MNNNNLEKYIEYKKKYLELKHQQIQQLKQRQRLQLKQGQRQQLKLQQSKQENINYTYLLFMTSKLILDDNLEEDKQIENSYITPIKSNTRNKPSYLADYTLNLTPKLSDNLTPVSRKRMLEEIEIDNDILTKLSKMEEKIDLDYINYENYGKLIESWLSDKLPCPCCKSNSLKRYSKNNMPIIDVVCINPSHTLEIGVRFFQIKTSNGQPFMDMSYFVYNPKNPEQNHIHVGSRKYGKIVHEVKVSDSDFDKKILIGYICLTYKEKEDLQIIKDKSFVVLPIIDYQLKNSTTVDDWYYKYIDDTNKNQKHPRIKFNHNTNKIVEIGLDKLEKFIPKNYKIRKDTMDNPLYNFI